MARKSNHKTVVFLQDYATKKAGEELSCDGMLASSLVNRSIAIYKTAEADAPADNTTVVNNESEQPPLVNEESVTNDQEEKPVVETDKASENLIVEKESETDTIEISGTEAGTIVIEANEQEEDDSVNEVISLPIEKTAGEAEPVKESGKPKSSSKTNRKK